MKSKLKSSKTPAFAKGGSGKMAGQQHAGSQKPGVTSNVSSGGGGKFIKGGSKPMFGKQSAAPAPAGRFK